MSKEGAWDQAESDEYKVALALAVIHHGLANFSQKAVPVNSLTVLKTADLFLDYIFNVGDGESPVAPKPRN